MEWTKYPNGRSEYAYDGDLVLTAFDNGSWAVWNSTAPGNHTSADSKEPLSGSLDKAKQMAEEAAKTMRP